ncbi:hypothetical protein EON80_18835 [bacterium]|nr:MAG: hypothetical protein EON80_18835 [bacterium]
MTNFRWRMLAAASLIVAIFVGLVGYSMRVAPRMQFDSKIALNEFLVRCQNHDYKGARQFLNSALTTDISETLLRSKWAEFEAKNGKIRNWKPADLSINGFQGSVCVFPPFVDFRHAVFGAKGTGTIIYIRMAPENGDWKLERFSFLR